MTQAQPLVVQTPGVTYEAADFRNIFDALFTEGVRDVGAGQLAVTALTDGTLRVAVAAGNAFVKGDDVPGQGLYILRTTAGENVSVSAPPSSGSRLDLLVYEEIDADVVALAGRPAGSRFRAVPGTAVTTGSPVLPALPNTAIPLASFPVAAGQTTIPAASITDLRGQANAAAIQIGTQAASYTSTALAGQTPSAGRLAYVTDVNRIEFGSGTSWLPLPYLYGEGPDGDVVLAAGTTTLTRDMDYRTLRVPSGATLITAGFTIRAQVSVTVDADGVIHDDGGNGGNGGETSGAGGKSGGGGGGGRGGNQFNYMGTGGGGGAGGGVVCIVTPSLINNGIIRANGGAGGNGGSGSANNRPVGAVGAGRVSGSGTAGGNRTGVDLFVGGQAGGTATSTSTGATLSQTPLPLAGQQLGSAIFPFRALLFGGAGGDGANTSTTNAGPGGGGGGGGLVLTVTVSRTGSGTYQVAGGAAGLSNNTSAYPNGAAGAVGTIAHTRG